MVTVGHLRRSSLSNRSTAELKRLIGQKGKNGIGLKTLVLSPDPTQCNGWGLGTRLLSSQHKLNVCAIIAT